MPAIPPCPPATFPVSIRRREAGWIRGKSPVCGDSNDGLGTLRRPPRPRTPGPRKSGNALANNKLANNHPVAKTMHVACYGYRYMDPLTGRWPSRDPIEEGLSVANPSFFADVSLYSFVLNNPTRFIDFLGLVAFEYVFGESNCFGYGVSGGNEAESIFPRTDDRDRTIPQILKYNYGWQCTEVKTLDACKCKCEEQKIAVTLWKNDNPKNQGKNPWTSKTFNWNNNLVDLHTLLADKGCSSNYRNIDHWRAHPQKSHKSGKKEFDLFKDPKNTILCCCRKKQ